MASKKEETRFKFSEATLRFQLLRFLHSIPTYRRDLKKGRKWLGRGHAQGKFAELEKDST